MERRLGSRIRPLSKWTAGDSGSAEVFQPSHATKVGNNAASAEFSTTRAQRESARFAKVIHMPIFEVRLSPVVNDPTFAVHARDLPQSLDAWLMKQHGGSCVGRVTDTITILEIAAPCLDTFRKLIDAYVEGQQRHGRRVHAVILQKDAPILTPAQADLARSLTPQNTKLTKRFFMSLPSGAFVASNVLGGPGLTPSFAGPVADSADARTEQWERAVAVGAAQRTCRVFAREAQFREWLKDMEFLRQVPPARGRSPEGGR